jgi:signal transduction histidine kinase
MHGHVEESRGFLILANDISERKQLEIELSLAKKMESIGQLAAGIAHEINTPTQFVSDNLRFLQDSFCAIQTVLTTYDQLFQTVEAGQPNSPFVDAIKRTLAEADLEFMKEEIPKALKQSLDGANRVSNIVRAMKDFSHPGTEEKKPIDLNRAIESTAIVARNEWKYVADMVTDLDPALPLVPCQAGEFNQVILNLLINGAHTINDVISQTEGNKGKITISTRVEGEWVEVRVADTGTGISEAVRDKIFDPFFTTKEVGKGTGQGLAIAHDFIVNKHGGTLTFETELGKGTTFVIRLPLQRTHVC